MKHKPESEEVQKHYLLPCLRVFSQAIRPVKLTLRCQNCGASFELELMRTRDNEEKVAAAFAEAFRPEKER